MAAKRKLSSIHVEDDKGKCSKTRRDENEKDEGIHAYRVLLENLGKRLCKKDLQRIAQLEGLSERDIDIIFNDNQDSAGALFRCLEKVGKLHVNDVSRLRDDVRVIEHMDAVKLIDDYDPSSSADFPPEPEYDDADSDTTKTITFDEILKAIGLEGTFPGKLTLEEFLTVRCDVDSSNILHSFWQKITCLDYRAALPQNLSSHPMIQCSMRDFIFSVLHCADDFLRQDILEKLSACQLAVPILLSGIKWKKRPIFLRWACRRIMKKWKGRDDSFAIEQPIVRHPIFTVAVLRIGEVGVSKSQLLNHILGPCQGFGSHPYFLTNECDKAKPLFSLGSIESMWFLPTSGSKNEMFRDAMAFLNLRGDSTNYPTQREFACKVANLTVVLVSTDERQRFVEVIRDVKKSSSQVLFVSLKESKGDLGKLQVERNWIFAKGCHVETLSKKICEEIESIYNLTKADTLSLSDFSPTNVDIDENNVDIQKAESVVGTILNYGTDHGVIKFKNDNFNLQNTWKKLAQLDKECFTFDTQDGTTFEQKILKQKAIKRENREAQLQCKLSKSVQCYLSSVKNASEEETFVKYFLSILHDKIVQMVSNNTHVHMKTILKLEEKIRQYKVAHPETDDGQREQHDRDLENYEMLVTECNKLHESCKVKTLGCEHFLREIGQQYEAYKEACGVDKTSIDSTEFPLYPSIAAQLILQMHSFELMDGDTGCIPITWVTAVLDTLRQKLNDPQVLVLSIIGVQSSGKSTLLNSMFGLRFPVRAGRRTRGLFIRLLKVKENLVEDLGFSYLIVVDTEGLRSIDHDDHKFDNELVTFALSIANLTIFNIGGENIGHDMVGVLQIAAHALMRMKEVDLKTRCKIVQQRVSDITAADMNKSNTNKIKATLDRATIFAAEEEGLEGRYKQFSDVVDLRIDVDLQNIPCLWTGGMSPPNHLYGEKVTKIREGLFDDIREKTITADLTLSTFTERVRDVWKAVKEENFIFNFQDSVRAVDFNQLCLRYNAWIVKMRQSIMIMTRMLITYLNRSVSLAGTEFIQTLMETNIEENKQTLSTMLDDYLTNHPRKNVMSKHRQGFLEDINITMKEVKNQADMTLTEEIDIIKLQLNTPKLSGDWLVKALSDVNKMVCQLREESTCLLGGEKREQCMNTLWENWTKDIKAKSGIAPQILSPMALQSLCEKLLLKVTRDMAVGSEIKNLLSHEGGLENHSELPDCSKYIHEKYMKVWTLHTELNNENDSDIKQQETVVNNLSIHQKKELMDVFVRSVISNRILELQSEQRLLYFDRNVFQLMVRKTILELSTKKNGIKLPQALIAKGLLHLCSKSIKDVFGETRVCANNFRGFYTEEDNIVSDYLLNVISERDPAVCAANVIYVFMKSLLRDEYIKSASNCIESIQLPWDLLTFFSNGDHGPHLMFPSIQLDGEEYMLHEYLIQETATRRSMVNSMIGKLETFEKELPPMTTYKQWTECLVQKCKIDCCILITNELFHGLSFLLVSKYLKNRIQYWTKQDLTSEFKMSLSQTGVATCLRYVCSETCPMCGVFCDNIMISHIMHSSNLHRPRGMAGETYLETDDLVIEDCNASMSWSIATFTHMGEKIPCRNYKRYFPRWNIRPSRDDPGKRFWQWVFAHNGHIISEIHNKSIRLIPRNWYKITEEEALQSLKHDKILKTEGRQQLFILPSNSGHSALNMDSDYDYGIQSNIDCSSVSFSDDSPLHTQPSTSRPNDPWR